MSMQGLMQPTPLLISGLIRHAATHHAGVEIVSCLHGGEQVRSTWRQVEARWRDSSQGFPGVFEYEVISELGTLLGDHVILNDGQLPEVDKARTMIRTLLTDFFSPVDGDQSG